MKKFLVTSGIFEGTSFYGDFSNGRIINNESIGQSYPATNCKLIYVGYGTYINNALITNVIELSDGNFLYGLCKTNKKGNAIKGGSGALGTFNIDELYNLLILSNLFPEPKKIDYRKFIQPMQQDFIVTKNGAKISNMIPNN